MISLSLICRKFFFFYCILNSPHCLLCLSEENARKQTEKLKEKIQQMREEQQRQKLNEERANHKRTVEMLEYKLEEEKRRMREKMEQVQREKELVILISLFLTLFIQILCILKPIFTFWTKNMFRIKTRI